MKQFEEYDSYILHDCQEKDLVEYDLYLKRCMTVYNVRDWNFCMHETCVNYDLDLCIEFDVQ